MKTKLIRQFTLGAIAYRLLLAVGIAYGVAGSPQSAGAQAEQETSNGGNSLVPNELFENVTGRAQVTRKFEIYNPRSKEQLQAVKEMGFTQVILDRSHLHADASEVGLDVVMAHWWTGETENQEIDQALENLKKVDSQRLVAVSMMDEPERYAPETPFMYYQALYYQLRTHFDKAFPKVKLEISHWGPLASWTQDQYDAFIPLYQSVDRMRLMPYPDLFEGPLDDVYYQMARSRHLMKLAEQPLPQVVILQTWVIPDNPKLPTIDELRVMAYQAMLAGADTLSFFSYDPAIWSQTAGFAEGFAELMQELTYFSQQYQEAWIESRMDSDGILTAIATWPGGEQASIQVNTNRTRAGELDALAVVVHSSKPSVTQLPTQSIASSRATGRRIRGCRRPVIRNRNVGRTVCRSVGPWVRGSVGP
jgi:hypothetical protein